MFLMIFQASLFFANYGTSADFNHLKNLEANLTDQMVLLRTGKLSIEEKVSIKIYAMIQLVCIHVFLFFFFL